MVLLNGVNTKQCLYIANQSTHQRSHEKGIARYRNRRKVMGIDQKEVAEKKGEKRISKRRQER